eukprot:3538818-Rhodomonas_salina.1
MAPGHTSEMRPPCSASNCVGRCSTRVGRKGAVSTSAVAAERDGEAHVEVRFEELAQDENSEPLPLVQPLASVPGAA